MKRMRRLITVLLGSLAAALFCLPPPLLQTAAGPAARRGGGLAVADRETTVPEGFEVVLENAAARLHVNPVTSEIAVELRGSGACWYSNPQDRAEDPLARGINAARLGSQFTVSYNTPSSQTLSTDNYTDAIANAQFEIDATEESLVIHYVIGEEAAVWLHPQALPAERFEAIYEQVDAGQQRILRRRYREYVFEDLKPAQRDEILTNYPGVEEQPIYVLNSGISDFILEEISEAFRAIGYTEEDRNADEAAVGMAVAETEEQNIRLTVRYELDGPDLIVRVPVSEIHFDATHPLLQLRVLEYFGAGGAADEGYLFVPDGSGALIDLNNGKFQTNQYISPVYGYDTAVRQNLQVGIMEQIALPVFGLKRGELAHLAIIEEGSALASIRADIAGRVNSYNTVCASFQILAMDVVDLRQLAGHNIITAYQQAAYPGELRLRYRFLSGAEADYSGMANSYRDYLLDTGRLRLRGDDAYRLQLEVLGAVDRVRPVLGLPVNSIQKLTGFAETAAIATELLESGVSDINLRLSGWFNGGLRQSVPSRIRLQRQLGSRAAFEALVEMLAANGVRFYPDATFSFIYRNDWLDGFVPTRDAARFLDREMVELRNIHPATLQPRPMAAPFWSVSPRLVPEYGGGFLGQMQRFALDGLSVRHAGRQLGSDFRREQEVDRESALGIWQAFFAQAKDDGRRLMFEYGNAYTLPFADALVELPPESSSYLITDRSVPFMAMVLHGCLDYSLTAMNLGDDLTDHRLAVLEAGASPYFTVMQADNSLLKDSQYNYYFSVEYAAWRDVITATYAELREILEPLQRERIIRHEVLADGVTRVSYSDGTRILVNRSQTAYSDGGVEVPPRDYRVTKGGAR